MLILPVHARAATWVTYVCADRRGNTGRRERKRGTRARENSRSLFQRTLRSSTLAQPEDTENDDNDDNGDNDEYDERGVPVGTMVKSRGCIQSFSLSPATINRHFLSLSLTHSLTHCSLSIENHFVRARTVFAPRPLDCCFPSKNRLRPPALPLLFIGDYIRRGFSGSVRKFLTARGRVLVGPPPPPLTEGFRTVLADDAELLAVTSTSMASIPRNKVDGRREVTFFVFFFSFLFFFQRSQLRGEIELGKIRVIFSLFLAK